MATLLETRGLQKRLNTYIRPLRSSQILQVAQAVLQGVDLIPKELRPHKTGPGAPVVLASAGTQHDEADWVAQVRPGAQPGGCNRKL